MVEPETVESWTIDEDDESVGIGPADVPWRTAPEYVEQALAALDIDPDTEAGEYAIELAHRYGLTEPTDHAPRSIAAGAVYLGMLVHSTSIDRPVTQPPIAESLGIASTTITRTYRYMAVEEEYAIPDGDDADEADGRESNGVAQRIRRWLGR